MKALLGLGVAVVAGIFLMQATSTATAASTVTPAGPDYTTAAHTRDQISKWSKTKLIEAGYWDNDKLSMTASYYALPQR